MMKYLTLLFPVGALALIAPCIFPCFSLLRDGAPLPPRGERRMTRRDWLNALSIMLVYAAIGFYAVGDREGITSFCKFEHAGQSAVVELDAPETLGGFRYYSGLFIGVYQMELQTGEGDWIGPLEIAQDTDTMFKWYRVNVELDVAVKKIRLTADSRLWLGELVLLDRNGIRIDASRLRCDEWAKALLDEQDAAPERATCLNSAYYDESYHAGTALENIENIYPYEISHPPLAKLILSLGIRLLGMTPLGWRLMGTLTGVLMVPAMYVFLKKLFGGVDVPYCLTTVFAFDFMHFVQTRIATIDSYAVFFILLMYLFFWMYLDAERGEGSRRRDWLPWLALSGVCFGLGAASKWICLYAGAGLGAQWCIDRVSRALAARREGKTGRREAAENILWCLLFFVLIPAAIYYASYYPYGKASGMEGVSMYFRREYLDIVLENQRFMLGYHAGVNAPHPYSSRWYQWIFDVRPILYYLGYPEPGMASLIVAFLNPALCWGGLAAVLIAGWRALRRDRLAGFLFLGYLAQLLPWVAITRTLFEYHYFAASLFLVAALGYVFSLMERRSHPAFSRSLYGFTALSLALFALFYPVLSGMAAPIWYMDNILCWIPKYWPF